MSKTNFIQYVRGTLFTNDYPKWNGRRKAEQYCEQMGIPKEEIYAVKNPSEVKYLELLLKRDDVAEIMSHPPVFISKPFTNCNGDKIPSMVVQASFSFLDKNTGHHKVVIIPKSIYEITRELIFFKTIYDCEMLEMNKYLAIYLYDEENETFNEWKIGDKEEVKKIKKQEHKRLLAQKRAIRDRQKYDRLLKLRSEGKITTKQTKELYRLEKYLGGNNQ